MKNCCCAYCFFYTDPTKPPYCLFKFTELHILQRNDMLSSTFVFPP